MKETKQTATAAPGAPAKKERRKKEGNLKEFTIDRMSNLDKQVRALWRTLVIQDENSELDLKMLKDFRENLKTLSEKYKSTIK